MLRSNLRPNPKAKQAPARPHQPSPPPTADGPRSPARPQASSSAPNIEDEAARLQAMHTEPSAQTALHKPTSVMYVDATEESFEPKVLVPFARVRGRVPRRIEVERQRRLFESQDLNQLLELAGLHPEELVKRTHQHLPLEIFDDTSYDCRDAAEWMSIARAAPRPDSQFLPARAFRPDATGATSIYPCRVIGWDAKTNKLTLLWGAAKKATVPESPEYLPRIFVQFLAEDPVVFVQRLVNAEKQRKEATSWIKYRLCCDAMPIDGLPGVEAPVVERLRKLGSGIPLLSKERFPSVEERTDKLISELNLEWRRTHNRLLFQHQMYNDESLQKVVQNTTKLSLVQILAGPDGSATKRTVPQHKAVTTEGYDYEERNKNFTFSTYFTQREVVAALTGVRNECIKVLEGSLFSLPKSRQMPLPEFEAMQIQAMDKMTEYLKTTWKDNICLVINSCFKNIGKGWLNINEQDLSVYEVSKLKKFFTTVRYTMEDTLFELVYNSLQDFTAFYQEVSDFTVTVKDMNTVVNKWPGSDANDAVEKQPLFTIDLVEKDGSFAYSTPPKQLKETIIALFDRAIRCTAAIPQVEKYIMTQYFWSRDGDGPFLDTVKEEEDRVCDLREKVRGALSESLEPLNNYITTYDELLDVVRLNKATYIAEYAEEEHSNDDMKEEIRRHLKNKKNVSQKIPTYITVGNFVIDCQSFCYAVANKYQDMAKLVMDLICRIAKKKTSTIREEFTKIVKVFEKAPHNAEKLYDIKSFISNLPEKVFDLKAQIADMRIYYTILEGFQYGLSDEDFRHKWEAIGWPRQLDNRIDLTNRELEKTGDELHDRMLKDMEEFQRRVDTLQRVVATFSKYTDAKEADKVAAEVKTHNIEIKKCIEEARNLNNDQKLFGDPLTDYRNVFDLEKEFKPFSDLWLTTHLWQDSLHKWHTDPFDAIDPDELDQTVQTAQKTMIQLAKTFREKNSMLKIVEGVKLSVEEFKPVVPIVMALRNQGMKERHWTGLSEKLNQPLVPGETILTVNDCHPLIAHKDAIVSHCEVAAKEFGIEKALTEMRSKWVIKTLKVEEYKETKTYIVKDATEIVEMLDEHMNTTQQLQFSAFKAHFADQIDEWEKNLNLMSDILEQWLECQRSWRYLQPIFASEDIAMQLPKLHKMFEKVDRQWRKMMAQANANPNVLTFCTSGVKVLDVFRDCNRMLEEVQKGLNDYLQDKRQCFPRFYFLSDEELLEILSQSKDVRRIDDHLRKLFEFIDHMTWKDGENTMLGFNSVEGEYLDFPAPFTPEGNVENWLREVENLMKASVHRQLQLAMEDYPSEQRKRWVTKWAGQAVIAIAQVYWTSDCETVLEQRGTVRSFAGKCEKQLMELVDVVQGPLKAMERINMGALITIEVHAKDTIDNMVEAGVTAATSFDWMKQLRFYFDHKDQKCHIHQVDARFVYGGEYLGNTGRLVVTPLTDRIYLTLTGALSMCLGGAPAGPAGTGKTETTKDLAKALAKQCVVFNCQEGMTYLSMGKFFKGLAWSGAWACFDEFNRIDVEVLSVVAQQVTDLQQACFTGQLRIVFEESDVVVDPTHAVFITMNPGYAGRTELPDNLKVLFRPVACMVPDYALIGEIRLFSYGYRKARALAQKMVMTFKLSSEQLSSQDHYDFGMRAVNTVISAAGLNKRENPNENEDILLLRALRDSNLPKFLHDDIVLFEGIITDLFPGIDCPPLDLGAVQAALETAIRAEHLQTVPAFVSKCLQLYDVTTLRHGLMLVGPTGSGKTRAYRALQTALSAVAAKQAKGMDTGGRTYKKVYTHISNPKAVTMDQLYGAYDENGEWKDGVLAILFRRAAKYGDEGNLAGLHWVLFDGPVDALWIESMNTVLDENKKLCLVSGEIIQMNRDMTMMFEVEDLAVASPATVSRCGMIYMDPAACTPTEARIASWLEVLPKHYTSQADILKEFTDNYLSSMVEFVRRTLKEYVVTVDNNLVQSFFNMMDAYIALAIPPNIPGQPPGTIIPERQQLIDDTVISMCLMSLIWSVGASCDDASREEFSHRLRQKMKENGHEAVMPADGQVYDYCYRFSLNPDDELEPTWVQWNETVPAFTLRKKTRYSDIMVPTVDTIRQNYVLKHLLTRNFNVAAVGPTGTGKSASITEIIMGGLPEKFQGLAFTFSAQTGAGMLQNSLMSKFDKRRSHVYGAPTGKQLVVFIDDTNLPQKEQYGAQPPIELMRQFLGHGGFYNLQGHIKFNSVIDVTLALAMGPPGGGRNAITNRFMRYFNFVAFPEMSDESKRTILNSILLGGYNLSGSDSSITGMLPELVNGTINIFKKCCKVFLPTPNHVHYTFNMRDITRVFGALYDCPVKHKDILVRMWLHENTRVFGDRLINDEDRATFVRFLDEELKEKLGYEAGYKEAVTSERLIFGDYCNDRRIYEEITDMEVLTARINEYLAIYNEENQPQMNLVMFLDAIEHVSRISRVLRMPNGHCLLLGMGGSGRKSMTRLAVSLCDQMELFTVEITKSYTLKDWRENLAQLVLGCGKDDKKVTFLFSDSQIVRPIFLEDVASLLTSGDVPNLFEDKEIELINDKFKGICMSEGLPTTKIALYSRFIKDVRSNLHIVLAFSPVGEAFRSRMRMFPSLATNCTIDWFAEWPPSALLSVGRAQLEVSGLPFATEELTEAVPEIFSTLHRTASEATEQFFLETKRRSYVTPTSYLSLISTFVKLLRSKREFISSQRGRLVNGLDKLRDTEERVAELEESLRAQQPILKQTQENIKELMASLAVDREIAAEKEAVARTEENEAAAKAHECSKMRKQCADRLSAAEPALVEAVKVVREVKPSQLSELGNYTTISDIVRKNLEAVALLLNFGICPKEYYSGPPGGKKLPDWLAVARSKLKGVNEMLRVLTNKETEGGFDKDRMDDALMDKIRPYYESEECTPARARTGSSAIEALCKWMRAMYDWFYINKEVIPLRQQLSIAEEELGVVNGALAVTRGKLKEVVDKVKALQQEYESAVANQKSLENEMELTTQKLTRAARLIDGLAGEKQRWIDTIANYDQEELNIVGNTLLAAGAVAYFGPLTAPFRRSLLSSWHSEVTKLNVPCSEQYDPVSTTGDPVEIQGWRVHGLPSDALSTENAIIMNNAGSWPLLIDPQGQANSWIRSLHKENNLQVCKPSEDKFMKVIEGAIRLGFPCLLENVGETLEPALDPILLKQTYLIGSSPHIRVGDSVIPYDPNFRLYMTTKLPNPTYSPETVVTVTLLNFFITPSGLEDQLLGKTVEKERKDLETQKQQLTKSNADKSRELKTLQDDILKMLQEAEGDILEQEVLINALEMSKKKSTEINEDLAKAKETEQVIDETRERYRPHAFRGSLLFFCVSAISSIDPMYQFSLQWFMTLFNNCIDKAERFDDDVDARIESIKDYTTYNFYCNVTRSLFEKHKLMLSFFLCLSITQEEGHIDPAELRFLLTGSTTTATSDNPAPEWLTARAWNDVQFANDNLTNLMGLSKHVADHIGHYRDLFDAPDAHRFPLAGTFSEECSPLHRLIFTRIFRLDKLTHAIQDFVTHFMGERYIIVPQFNLADAYKDSDCCTPLIFIISPGSDPMGDLLKFAESMRMSKKLDKVSLGQGQGKKAEELLANGMEKGQWVLLQNCHLATSWMPTLEQIVENFHPETIKKEFRLWLTSMPSPSFPVAVLQNSVKMTNEPPMGLRANLTRSFFGFKEDDLGHRTKPNDFKRMLFAQCLFHGVIQERRKFGSLGFNIPYEFNDSDRAVCVLQLRKFMETYDKIPFDVLVFLTGEINYGGRVTDDWDRRCLMTMIKDFIHPKVLADGHQFSPLPTYQMIEPGNRSYYLDHLNTWPINPDPAIFGLHDNADITSARNETQRILATVLSLQSSGSAASGSAASRDAMLTSTANTILRKLPDAFDIAAFQRKYPTKYEESMNTVLVQEAVRYNKLLKFMMTSLKEFLRAVKGEVVMSAELEGMGGSLFVNDVPAGWAKLAYPSLMPLSSWVEDLIKRLDFIRDWYTNGPPMTFWIGGFFFPQAFLTGTLQNFARQVKEPIDTIKFGFKVLEGTNADVKERPTKGAIIYGIFMEGARWDPTEHSIVESRPKELFVSMPPLLLDPIVNKPPSVGVFLCPVYKTLTRAGTLSTTGHSTNFVLPIEIPTKTDAEHWIKRGVACLVSLNF